VVDSGDERFPDLPGARPLAEVALQEGAVSLEATVLSNEVGDLSLQVSVEGADGATGSGSGLASLESGTAVRQDIEDGGEGVLVAGLIGPSVTSVEIRDPATGRPVEGEGPSTATIDGSDHVLFLGRIAQSWSDAPLLAVGTRPDGTEVQVAF
jgi:hypothetical protein